MTKTVPVVLQMSAADCGAACLSMIMRYWGCDMPASVCQAEMGGGTDGVSALMIANAARSFGLKVAAFRHTSDTIGRTALPAIVHWQGVHFVVLTALNDKTARIIDPALGRRTLTRAQFAEKFSGVALTFAPTPEFEQRSAQFVQDSAEPTWKLYARRLIAVPSAVRLLMQLIGVSLLLQLIGLALPAATWLIVERILPLSTPDSLTLLGVALGVAVVGQAAVTYWRSVLAIDLQQRLDGHLVPAFFRHMVRLPQRFFQLRTTGDLIARLEGNSAVRDMITSGVLTGLLDGGLALLYLLILFWQAPLFGAVVTAAALAQLLLLARTSGRVHEFSQIELATQSEEDSFAVQLLRGIESIKAAGAEQWALSQWQLRFDDSLDASLRRGRYIAAADAVLQLLTFGTPLFLLWIGTLLVQQEQITLGQMLGLVVLATSSLAPLGSLAVHVHRAQQSWAYLERLADVLESEPEEKDANLSIEAMPLEGRIEVRDLSFRYRRTGAFTLNDISFAVQPGAKVAIVGASAAGKSTLLRLLLGFYPLEAGQIFYDGLPLDEIGRARLRRSVGVVLQEPFLFSGTIAENIALHRPAISAAEIRAAAKAAAIDSEIEQMPMGYATRVGEGGSGLSGGQRQRIALARALVNRPKILFLDEATSHLDEATEQRVHDALDKLQITRLIVAHRLSTVANCDQMLMLKDGKLLQQVAADRV